MTHTVNALEKRKLIRRRPEPSDKRVLLAEITPLGRKVVTTANRALSRISFGLADLDEDDATEVAIRLSRIHPATDEGIEATA
jgi:DNA-binding MarR family transcriptional regulator